MGLRSSDILQSVIPTFSLSRADLVAHFLILQDGDFLQIEWDYSTVKWHEIFPKMY